MAADLLPRLRLPEVRERLLASGINPAELTENAVNVAAIMHDLDRTQVLAALRAEAGAVGWMPIETAPKDGLTHILCCDEHGPYIGLRPIGCPDDAVSDLRGIACYPTHWQPLPPRPSQKD